MHVDPSRRVGDETTIKLRVLGGFAVEDGDGAISIPPAGQRVLAILAINGGAADRHRLAGLVWPDRPEHRAIANLRGAIWRLPPRLRLAVDKSADWVRLDHSWVVDLHDAVRAAKRLRAGDFDGFSDAHRGLLSADLLPDWDMDFLVVARERHHQLRLHALEDLAHLQIRAGHPLDAVDTALSAIAAEPLRETAQCLLLTAHLEAGNRAEVIRAFERFRGLLLAELDVEPGPRLRATVEQALGHAVTLR